MTLKPKAKVTVAKSLATREDFASLPDISVFGVDYLTALDHAFTSNATTFALTYKGGCPVALVSAPPGIAWADGTIVDKTVIVPQSSLPVIWTGNGFIADLTTGAVGYLGNALPITTDVDYPATGHSVVGTFPIVFTATDPNNGLSTSLVYTLIVEA